MNRLLVGVLTLLLAVVTTIGMSQAQDKKKKKKIAIKDVMKTCMKGGLCKKVAKGEASTAEKKKLLRMFRQGLAKNKPPRGDEESWKMKTTALVNAAKSVVDGKEGATTALGKAANCKACHEAHKGKAK